MELYYLITISDRDRAEMLSAIYHAAGTGMVLTKLDGTAKGGVVIAVAQTLQIPVKFIGVGEQIDDLMPFDAKSFAEALI